MRLLCSSLVLLAVAWTPLRAAMEYPHYQIIVDRLPFGRPPDKPAAPPPPPATPVETYAWGNDYRMTFITQTADNKAKVGLLNVKDQTTLSLESGETHPGTGIQLVSVNYDTKSASLTKGGQAQELKLQDPATAAPAAVAAGGRTPPSLSGRTSPTSASSSGRPSFARPPPPPAAPPAPAAPRLTGAELEKHLQDYQVEVIRRGLPPLPVQLTPENDAALVAEGKLPPQDAPPAEPEQ
jgi:hypothetical protein